MMTMVFAVLLVIALAGLAGLGITSSVIHAEIVENVNRVLPEDQRFDDGVWWLGKTVRLFREYRRLNPDAPLLRRQVAIYRIGALLLVVIFAALLGLAVSAAGR